VSELTIYQLLLTCAVEIGLGLIAYLGCVKLAPWLKSKAETTYSFWDYCITTQNQTLGFFHYWKYSPLPSSSAILYRTKPSYPKWDTLWLWTRGALFLLAELLPTFIILTSVGWKLPFTQHLYYNLIFATANNQPNGAHITSYLAVMFLVLFSAWKSKDVIFGVLAGSFLVAFHEGFWMIFYLTGYAQYFSMLMITNILKDMLAFIPMIILFAISYWKYPFRLGQMKSFKYIALIYLTYLVAWFFIPHLIDPFTYGFLPIRTANIPYNVSHGVTFTIYNETKYFWNPIVSGIEEISWIICALGIGIVIAREKIR
jgi:hypothetical protein